MNDEGRKISDHLDVAVSGLSGIDPEQIFLMGIEWQLFRQRLAESDGLPFTIYCLPANAPRLVKLAEHFNRFVEDRPYAKPGWTQIYVGDLIS